MLVFVFESFILSHATNCARKMLAFALSFKNFDTYSSKWLSFGICRLRLSWAELSGANRKMLHFLRYAFVLVFVVVYMLPSMHSLSATQRIDRETTEKSARITQLQFCWTLILKMRFSLRWTFFSIVYAILPIYVLFFQFRFVCFVRFFISLPFYRYDCY